MKKLIEKFKKDLEASKQFKQKAKEHKNTESYEYFDGQVNAFEIIIADLEDMSIETYSKRT